MSITAHYLMPKWKRTSVLTEKEKMVESPCVAICYLDENDICAGCFRSGDEITAWGSYRNDQRREVLKLVNQRRADSGFVL
jgi:predicted Fe-S protein YdhL (DUF1289 family)